MTGLIPFYLKTVYKKEPVFAHSKVVYTIGQNTFKEKLGANFTKTANIHATIKEKDLEPFSDATNTALFRAGATYVRVDAYPTLDGRIIQGLTKDDFELLEDGKPQTIASTEFVAFGAPDDARGSMLSAREGLELAADPHYRVAVFVLDRAVFDLPQWRTTREDLHDFLDSQVGPGDLGRVIGRRGRTAQSIRTVVRAAATRDGVEVDVDFVD
jgi:predicted RNA-binding protein YlqC (UPF0109 family)